MITHETVCISLWSSQRQGSKNKPSLLRLFGKKNKESICFTSESCYNQPLALQTASQSNKSVAPLLPGPASSGVRQRSAAGWSEALWMSPGSPKLSPSDTRWALLLKALLAHKAPFCKSGKDSPYLSDATLAWQADRIICKLEKGASP